jgi:hypothetical protein
MGKKIQKIRERKKREKLAKHIKKTPKRKKKLGPIPFISSVSKQPLHSFHIPIPQLSFFIFS